MPENITLALVLMYHATIYLASSPGSNTGAGGKREPGIHCLRMRQKYNVNDVTIPYVTRL